MAATMIMGVVLLGGAACDSGRPCTAIGSPSGVSVTVRPPDAARVASAELRVCWDEVGCRRTGELELRPSSTSVPVGCEGDEPDAVCGASASPDGGKHGFAEVMGLPTKPVDIVLVLRDAEGDELLDEPMRVTPEETHPNGRHCPPGGPQVGLTVAEGRVTVR